ncbi:MAG: hypothetical protein R6V55_13595 [Desulfovermiculus sp.]
MPETTRQSLYPYIELFCHALDLVDRQDERLNKLTRALHSSLGLYGLYYELKQGSSGLEIDLSCEIPLYVDKESFSAALLELDIPGSWQDMLQEMLSPQSTSCSAKPKISMMGLEFDSHCPSALKPSIFFTAPQGEGPNIQWLRAIMHEIQRTGYSLHGIHDRLNALHNALHAPSHVVHAGFMLPRGNNGAVKIILSGISTQQLSLTQKNTVMS